MTMMNIVTKQLTKGATVGIAGGLVAIVLTMVLGVLPADAISLILINIGLLVLLIIIAAKTKIEGLNLYNFVVLLTSIGIVGSIVNIIVPGVSQFILSAPDFTVSGLLMSLIYIGMGMWVLAKANIKV